MIGQKIINFQIEAHPGTADLIRIVCGTDQYSTVSICFQSNGTSSTTITKGPNSIPRPGGPPIPTPNAYTINITTHADQYVWFLDLLRNEKDVQISFDPANPANCSIFSLRTIAGWGHVQP
jgi:hypothetical protein